MEAGFNANPVLEATGNTDEWRLVQSLIYVTQAFATWVIPAGFLTDLASIPRIFRAIFPVNGKHRPAAILHDYLYSTHFRTRAESDSLFLEAMTVLGVPWAQRWAMYLAVRAGGWIAWQAGEKKKKENPKAWAKSNGL